MLTRLCYGPRVRWMWPLLLVACGGEAPARESHAIRPTRAESVTEAATAQPSETTPSPEEPSSEEPSTEEPAVSEPDFSAPLPDTPCPDQIRVRLAHRGAPELPPVLEHAAAYRSEDGRRIRVILSSEPIEPATGGGLPAPSAGRVRFEMDALRTRRRPLTPRVLGPPGSRSGALTHARIVWDGPFLTFGHRDVGRVEITAVEPDHVCGRVELDDGFGRVRGAFRAPLQGRLPY